MDIGGVGRGLGAISDNKSKEVRSKIGCVGSVVGDQGFLNILGIYQRLII